MDLIALARAHSQAFLVRCFFISLDDATIAPALRAPLVRLATLHALTTILADAGDFMHSSMMSSAQIDLVRDAAYKGLAEVFLNVVCYCKFVDYFNHWQSLTQLDSSRRGCTR